MYCGQIIKKFQIRSRRHGTVCGRGVWLNHIKAHSHRRTIKMTITIISVHINYVRDIVERVLIYRAFRPGSSRPAIL